MRKFIIKILFFCFALFVPLAIADIFMTISYRNRDYYPFTTWTNIINGRLNSDIWILGSSRAWVHYNPHVLDSNLHVNSYNLGCNAQYIFPELQCCEIAKSYNLKPKYIILDLFFGSLTMNLAGYSKYCYMPYINKIKLRRIIKDNSNISPAYLYLPYYRYHIERVNDYWFENNKGDEYKGFKAMYDTWNGNDLNSFDTVHYKCEPDAIILLNDFLEECKKEDITVILVHSPFYYEGFEKINNHEKMMELFKNIANKNNVTFLDYTKSPISFDTLYFYNAMHLNAKGAYLFSTQLAHDLDSLGIIPSNNN